MATTDDNRGVRLQAERVVRAYHELRAAPKNADFKSDDFPVGLFAELVQQIKQLDGWLQPTVDDTTIDATDSKRHAVPENRRSGGTDWDDMTLELERVTDMVNALDQQIVGHEAHEPALERLITPVTLLRLEVEYLDAAIHQLEPNWHEPEAAEPHDLHAETVAEIREEYPDADEREVKLRVAIRESFGATHSEEDAAYERIAKAAS